MQNKVIYAIDPTYQDRVFLGEEKVFIGMGFTIQNMPQVPYSIILRGAWNPNSSVSAGQSSTPSAPPAGNPAPVAHASGSARQPVDFTRPPVVYPTAAPIAYASSSAGQLNYAVPTASHILPVANASGSTGRSPNIASPASGDASQG